MADEDRSIVTAEELFHYCGMRESRFMEFVLDADADAIYKMCIVDYLISNPDRHMQNWGFYQSDNTGELQGAHPLFDHNRAFDESQMEMADGGESLIFRHQSKRDAAVFAMGKCDLHFIRKPEKDMFFDESHYESFIKRSDILRLG